MAETDRWSPPEGTELTFIGASRWLADRGLKKDRRTIRRWVDRGYLKSYIIAGQEYIYVGDLEALLEDTPWGKESRDDQAE